MVSCYSTGLSSLKFHGFAALTNPPALPQLRRRRALFVTMLAFVVILVARVCLVSLYASDTPFWDQWDGEACFLLKPWVEGTLSWNQLFIAHNEHRIVLTRLLILLLFELNNHHWSNILEAYVNILIAAAYLSVVVLVLMQPGRRLKSTVTFTLVIALGALPFSWENFLVGFQSQFYFMALFAVGMIALASFRSESTPTIVLVAVIGLVGLFTTASGLVAALSVMFAGALHSYRNGRIRPTDRILVSLMLLVVALGLCITHTVASHDSLKPSGLIDNLRALSTVLVWPVHPVQGGIAAILSMFLIAALLWMPSVTWMACFLRSREASSREIFAISLSAWSFIQCVAIAHSRGHDMAALSSRYLDITALGLVANLWLVITLFENRASWRQLRHLATIMAVAFVALITFALIARTDDDIKQMTERASFAALETRNVAGYLRTKNAVWLDQPGLEIPYPDASRLKQLLDDPTITRMLPSALSQTATPSEDPAGRLSAITQHLRTTTRNILGKFMMMPALEPASDHPENVTTDAEMKSAAALPVIDNSGYCTLDQIDGKATASREISAVGTTFQVRGWAVPDVGRDETATRIWIALNDNEGHRRLDPVHEVARADVATALGRPSFVTSGFDATISIEGLSRPVTVRILQAFDHKALACQSGTLTLL